VHLAPAAADVTAAAGTTRPDYRAVVESATGELQGNMAPIRIFVGHYQRDGIAVNRNVSTSANFTAVND
jgi:hypothetical protein